ncbi:MAG: nucleotidyltransferase domain-containing protein [Candidatus Liptonbacteria bacterium]|nr:nucleotidyltransferase domain-containing protein [Candidatus Liptonbacteria bacterium]
MKPESFEGKLYNPRDVEGKPNTEALEQLRDVEKDLKNNPAFIGIVPGGSRIKGYSIEGSDIDVLILFDSSKIDSEKDKNDFLTEYSFKGFQFLFLDVNLEKLLPDLQLDPRGDGMGAVIQRMAALTELVSGHQVGDYRNAIKQSYNQLSKDARDIVKNRAVDLLMDKEEYAARKIEKRMADKLNKDSFLEQRRKLWEERYEQIWGMSAK